MSKKSTRTHLKGLPKRFTGEARIMRLLSSEEIEDFEDSMTQSGADCLPISECTSTLVPAKLESVEE